MTEEPVGQSGARRAAELKLMLTPPEQQADAEQGMIAAQMQKTVADLLLTLKPREERAIRLYFGFDDDAITLDELSQVTRERARQVLCRAMRHLKAMPRAKKLADAGWVDAADHVTKQCALVARERAEYRRRAASS
jgi:DNA-directed RNA polymerase sigma subunit (sigma70/sigma32)